MNTNYIIGKIDQAHIPGAMDLVWRVFLEFEAPEYCDEGIQEFKNFISLEAIKQRMAADELLLWGCFDGNQIIGVIASRPPCHIALLFVEKEHHHQGIARNLFNTVKNFYKVNSDFREMTVNSSPYAAETYHRLGFVDTDTEQCVNGIRFIPMKHMF